MPPEQKLFCAVVLQAFVDASAIGEPPPAKSIWLKRRARLEARKALEPSEPARMAAWEQCLVNYHNRRDAFEAARNTARNWLLADADDFPATCHLAGLDPAFVRDRARSLRAQGWQRAPASNEAQLAA